MKLNRQYARFGNSIVVAATVCAFLLFLSAPPPAHADDRDKCRHRIEKAEARLNSAIQRHGEHSPEAEARRRDLNTERDRCWTQYHAWWNGHDNQWHTERDWDAEHHDDHDNH